MQDLVSFHGDLAVEIKYLDRVKAHREADNLIQGRGWENGKGCAIGCTLEDYDHSRYPIELGLPEWLARLEDTIFEGLPKAHAMTWPQRFLEAIPVGVNVESVRHQLAIRRLDRLIVLQTSNRGKHDACIDTVIDQTIKAIEQVKALHFAEVDGKNCPLPESAAWSAAESAARSAAWSAAESAARSAARSAAARSAAAESAARSAAWSAWSAVIQQEAADLLELLAACK
jgi:hypothetical protein